jgi:hypothetical protein
MRAPAPRTYRGGTITRLAHGQHQVAFDGVVLGTYPTPATAEWALDDYLWYLADAGAIDPTTLPLQAIAEVFVAGRPQETLEQAA